MKFGRLLRTTAEDLPELMELFEVYKKLKKQLKRLPSKEEQQEAGARLDDAAAAPLTAEESTFVDTLTLNLSRMNDMFLEREETAVIQLERLQSEAKAAVTQQQKRRVYEQFVNFHGQVLLLVHWSVLGYTATVKILKKHHKRTGLLLRAPHLGDLLSQPFCSTELMTQLAHKAEEAIQQLVAGLRELQQQEDDRGAAGEAGGAAGPNPSTPNEAAAFLGPGLQAAGPLPWRQDSSGSGSISVQQGQRQEEGDEDASAPLTRHASTLSSGALPPPHHLRNLVAGVSAMTNSCSSLVGEEGAGQWSSRSSEVLDDDTSDSASWDAPVNVDNAPESSAVSTGWQSEGGAAAGNSGGGVLGLHLAMLRRTQVALGTWEQLKRTAITPSTVISQLPTAATAAATAPNQPPQQQPPSLQQQPEQGPAVGSKHPRADGGESGIMSDAEDEPSPKRGCC